MKLILNMVLLLTFVQACSQTQNKTKDNMKVAVWDTYVTKKDGIVMHFDILAPEEIKDTSVIYGYGKAYLKTKGQDGQPLTSKECRFCHVEILRPDWEADIKKQGYFIIEMENCK
ncbi:MAG: DUF2024 family protein [Bacteroidota bacterium]